MKYIYPLLGLVGLSMLLVPAIMHFSGNMETGPMKNLMLVGTVIWFAVAIPWLGRKTKEE